MKNILFLFFLICGNTCLAFSESFKIDSNQTFEFLYKYPNDIDLISNCGNKAFQFKINNGNSEIKIIKNELGLFILINGTGRVYKAASLINKTITFNRIDSTKFFGHNFNSLDFSYKNAIFSYGGYGYFNNNGQLRIFNNEQEYSIVPLNQEFREAVAYPNYLKSKSLLFFLQIPTLHQSTNILTSTFNVTSLDLHNYNIKILGKINDNVKIKNADFICNLSFLNGALVSIDNNIYLLDYENNKIHKLINESIRKLLFSKLNTNYNTFFSIDNKIYFNNVKNNNLSSFTISMNDFRPEPYSLYEETKNYTIIFGWSIIMLIMLFIAFLYNKKAIKNSSSNNRVELNDIIELNEKNVSNNEFNNVEKEIINLIIDNSEKKSFISVEQLNDIMGLKKKSLEIQKRVRSESINRINHKFNIIYNQNSIFIERVKSKEDARYYNYMINVHNIKIYRS